MKFCVFIGCFALAYAIFQVSLGRLSHGAWRRCAWRDSGRGRCVGIPHHEGGHQVIHGRGNRTELWSYEKPGDACNSQDLRV